MSTADGGSSSAPDAKRRRLSVAAPPPSALTSPAPVPVATALDLPPELLDAVFMCLLQLTVASIKGRPSLVGTKADAVVTREVWALASPAASVCRPFRAAFLGAVRNLRASFNEKVAIKAVGRWPMGRTPTQAFVERSIAVCKVVPKLPRLHTLCVPYTKSPVTERAPAAWVSNLIHQELFYAARMSPSIVNLSWSGPNAVKPSLLATLVGQPIKSLTMGGLHVEPGPDAAGLARAQAVSVLQRLAPTLVFLTLSPAFCSSVRVDGDRALTRFLGDLGSMPHLNLIRVGSEPPAGSPAAVVAAATDDAVLFQFPRLATADLSKFHAGGVLTVATLCRLCPLLSLSLPDVGPLLVGELLEAIGAGRRSPRKVVFLQRPEFDAASTAQWVATLKTTKELVLPGVRSPGMPAELASEPAPEVAAALAVLAGLPRLKNLTLHRPYLHPCEAASFVLPNLETLHLVSPSFPAASAAALVFALVKSAPALTSFTVSQWRGELGSALFFLGQLPKLREVFIDVTGLDNPAEVVSVSQALGSLRRAHPALRVKVVGLR